MAPEMLRNEGYDFLADVWSIGVAAMFGAILACKIFWINLSALDGSCRLRSLPAGLWQLSVLAFRGGLRLECEKLLIRIMQAGPSARQGYECV